MKRNLLVVLFFLIVWQVQAQDLSQTSADNILDYETVEIVADSIGFKPKEELASDLIAPDSTVTKVDSEVLMDYKLDNNLDYPLIKTSLGSLYVLPDYQNIMEEIKESLHESSDPYTIYLIKDNMIAKTLMLDKPIKVKDHLILFLSFDKSNAVTESIHTNDHFMLTSYGRSVDSEYNELIDDLYNEKLDALAQKGKFTKVDLDLLDICPIATPDGKIFFNGVEGVFVCSKLTELPGESGSVLLIAEVVDIFLYNNSSH